MSLSVMAGGVELAAGGEGGGSRRQACEVHCDFRKRRIGRRNGRRPG
jgi:hypothetical protein